MVVNPSARPRAGVVELVVAASEPADPTASRWSRSGIPLPGRHDPGRRHRAHHPGHAARAPRLDDDAWVHDVRGRRGRDRHRHHRRLRARGAPGRAPGRDQAGPLHPARRPARRHACGSAWTSRPSDGWWPGWPTCPASAGGPSTPAPLAHPVDASTGWPGRGARVGHLANGLVTVAVDLADGTFAVDGVAGFGRLVDGGDLGDSYNYSPPAGDALVDRPTGGGDRGRAGPGPGRGVVTATYLWPDHVDGGSPAPGSASTPSRWSRPIERAGRRAPRCGSTTSFVNPACDHRLRVHLPLPEPRPGTRWPSAPSPWCTGA